MAEIKLTNVEKVYPGGARAVKGVDLQIADGEFMIIVGPSGCAKSTLLRMIAGLEQPTSGTVEIGGHVVNNVSPADRDLAMVFQSYALYPHMTVRDNMSFGLRLRKMPADQITRRVDEAARILGLENLLDRLPKAMSGGQRQRVAMGRAIVREPQAFLMDEPLSNLDAKLRVQMRTEIARLHERLGTTTVYVTHDQVEALTLGQRICIMRAGILQQVDTPFNVYNNPANVFVGSFIGSPGMNFMHARIEHTGAGAILLAGGATITLPPSVSQRMKTTHSGEVLLGIRPEHLMPTSSLGDSVLQAEIELVETLGSEQYVYFKCDAAAVDLSELNDTSISSNTFVARISAEFSLHNGTRVPLMIDAERIHLFDPTSMETLLLPANEHGTIQETIHMPYTNDNAANTGITNTNIANIFDTEMENLHSTPIEAVFEREISEPSEIRSTIDLVELAPQTAETEAVEDAVENVEILATAAGSENTPIPRPGFAARRLSARKTPSRPVYADSLAEKQEPSAQKPDERTHAGDDNAQIADSSTHTTNQIAHIGGERSPEPVREFVAQEPTSHESVARENDTPRPFSGFSEALARIRAQDSGQAPRIQTTSFAQALRFSRPPISPPTDEATD